MIYRSKKTIYIVLILFLLIGFCIGYAALNTTLTINGTSTIEKNTWNVHFENLKVKEGSIEAIVEPTLSSGTIISNFQLSLNKPGDFYEFTIDVVNDGTLDAMISSIEKTPDLTENQKKYINYVIEYDNGEQIIPNQLVKIQEFVRVKVRVEYKKDISVEELPTETDNLSLGFKINYVQSEDTGIEVLDNGIIKVATADGSLDDIGTIVTIGSEQFYTIGTEGENVKLLSMMNITLEDNPIQSSSASTTKFSNNGSDYVGSIVEGYVNSYKTEIEKLGVSVIEARLITDAELSDSETFNCIGVQFCSSKYPWVYSTSYWSGSAMDVLSVWYVNNVGDVFADDINSLYGVRPVIIISKSEIDGNDSVATNKIIEFTIDGTTYQAEDGMTWLEWEDSVYNTKNISIDRPCGNYVGKNGTIYLSNVVENNDVIEFVFGHCNGGSND